MKVRFKVTRTVKDGTGTTFEEGKVYDLSEASAARWIRRGLAESVGPSSKASKPAKVLETNTVKPPENMVTHGTAAAKAAAGPAPAE